MLVHTAKTQKPAEAQKDQKTAEAVNELQMGFNVVISFFFASLRRFCDFAVWER